MACPVPALEQAWLRRWLTQGAQLIAPLLGPEDPSQGFAWCCEAVQQQGLGAVRARLCRAQAVALLDSCRAAEATALLQARPGLRDLCLEKPHVNNAEALCTLGHRAYDRRQ